MKKFFQMILVVPALVSLFSCSHKELLEEEECVPMATVSFVGRVSDATKALSGESSVSTLDVLVFRTETGVLETSSRRAGDVVSVGVPAGVSFTYCVVANAPEHVFDGVAVLDDFNSTLTYLEDNVTNLVMSASAVRTFDKDSDLELSLERYVSKVRLEGVTPEFMTGYLGSGQVRLVSIYLINVNGTCPMSGQPAAGELWYNKTESESLPLSLRDLLRHDCDVKVPSAETMTGDYDFYCCPNPVDNGVTSGTHPEWSVRNTRLVVEMDIGGVINYYPVTLPSMDCNCMYLIKDLVLTGPGSDDPDIPVDRSAVSFGIEVMKWGSQSGEIEF